jgi:hypothetical protein
METERSLQESLTWLTSICQVLGRGDGYASALRHGAGEYHRCTDGGGSGARWCTASHRRKADTEQCHVKTGPYCCFQVYPIKGPQFVEDCAMLERVLQSIEQGKKLCLTNST